ncbi:MAG: hypothetical protein VW166_05365 [Gammaproteobacteria bacterium]
MNKYYVSGMVYDFITADTPEEAKKEFIALYGVPYEFTDTMHVELEGVSNE